MTDGMDITLIWGCHAWKRRGGLGVRPLSVSLPWSRNGIEGRMTAWIHVIFQHVGADASEHHVSPCELTSVRQSGWKSSVLSFSHLSVCLWDVFPTNPCCVLMRTELHWKFTWIHLLSHTSIAGSILLPYDEQGSSDIPKSVHKCVHILITFVPKARRPTSTVACLSLGVSFYNPDRGKGAALPQGPPRRTYTFTQTSLESQGGSECDWSSFLCRVLPSHLGVRYQEEQQGPTVNQIHNVCCLLFCLSLLYPRAFGPGHFLAKIVLPSKYSMKGCQVLLLPNVGHASLRINIHIGYYGKCIKKTVAPEATTFQTGQKRVRD